MLTPLCITSKKQILMSLLASSKRCSPGPEKLQEGTGNP